jgi:hypothetical protein
MAGSLFLVQAGTCGFSFCLPWKGKYLKQAVTRPQQDKGIAPLDIFETALEVIDMRSFSNLWYWIALAVLWSSTSYWVLGVPFEMIQRGRREGGQPQQDVEDLVRINVARLLHMVDRRSWLIIGMAAFWMTSLALLAFFYDIEFAQAVFLLAFPMGIVVWISVWSSRRIAAGENSGEALYRRLIVHRRIVQTIGMLAIAVTAFYGTWQNVSASILY